LFTLIDSMIARKFLLPANRQAVAVAKHPGAPLDALAAQEAATTSKGMS
jgi:hypothetical protein